MNYLDWILLIIFLISAIKGYCKGLIHQLSSLIAFILGIYLAVRFSKLISPFIQIHLMKSENTSKIIAFFIVFIVVMILVHMLGKFLEKIFEGIELSHLNKITGSIFYVIKIAFIISIFMVLLKFSIIHLNWPNAKDTDKSYLYKPIESVAPSIFPYLKLENKN